MYLDKGNYKLAVIEAEIAFEVMVYKFLMDHLANEKLVKSIQNHTRGFTTNFNNNNNDEIKNLLKLEEKKFLKGNQSTESGENYLKWDSFVWKLRGDIIHGKKNNVTADEAWKAVIVVEETLNLLFDRPYTTRKKFSQSHLW